MVVLAPTSSCASVKSLLTPHLTRQLHKQAPTCSPPDPALHACPGHLLPRDEGGELGGQPVGRLLPSRDDDVAER